MNRQNKLKDMEDMISVAESDEIKGGIELSEMTNRLTGVVLRKAEMENNFEKVYFKVAEKMVEFEFFGLANGNNMLEIFGAVGG